jgi:hypothetical protein
VERSLPRSGIDAAPVGLRLCATVGEASARRGEARRGEARRRAWNGSLVPWIWFVITAEPENMRLTCRYVEPPIGIEPMTYALREGLEPSMAVQMVTPTLLARLLVPHVSGVVQGRC